MWDIGISSALFGSSESDVIDARIDFLVTKWSVQVLNFAEIWS